MFEKVSNVSNRKPKFPNLNIQSAHEAMLKFDYVIVNEDFIIFVLYLFFD